MTSDTRSGAVDEQRHVLSGQCWCGYTPMTEGRDDERTLMLDEGDPRLAARALEHTERHHSAVVGVVPVSSNDERSLRLENDALERRLAEIVSSRILPDTKVHEILLTALTCAYDDERISLKDYRIAYLWLQREKWRGSGGE